MKRNIRWVRNRKGIVSVFVCAVLFLFFIIYEKNSTTNIRYEITGLEENLKKEKAIEADLKVEIAKLSSPSRIEALAKSYGLVSVKPNQIVFLSDTDVTTKEKKEREESWGLFARIFERSVEAGEKW